MEGNIIVDGVLASCYAFPDHYLAHIAMTLIIWFPGIFEIILGKNIGSSEFINMVQDFGKWLLPFGFTYDRSKF